jgi:hypothetical protein
MEAALPAAARLLPPSVDFAAVGYACTSGATVIGPARVAELVRGSVNTAAVTEPLSALLAALRTLGVRRGGLIPPYVAEVSAALRAALEAAGHDVAAFASFEEQVEARVARTAPASIRAAALAIGARPEVEAVLLSCTNLRTLDVIDEVERPRQAGGQQQPGAGLADGAAGRGGAARAPMAICCRGVVIEASLAVLRPRARRTGGGRALFAAEMHCILRVQVPAMGAPNER